MEMDALVDAVVKADAKERVEVAEHTAASLALVAPSQIQTSHMADLTTHLANWASSSNYKISAAALSALIVLAEKSGDNYRAFVPELMPSVRERLGDSHDEVVERTQELLLLLMESVSSPQAVMDFLVPCFSHRAWRIRQNTLALLEQAVNKCGSSGMNLSKLVPTLAGLVSDPNEHVREAAVCALVEIYRNVGERVRRDITRLDSKQAIPSNKLDALFERFDAIRASGTMVAKEETPRKRAPGRSATTKARGDGSAKARLQRSASTLSASSRGSSSGGVTEEEFQEGMDTSPNVPVASERELETITADIKSIIGDEKNDWDKRVEALARLRGVVASGGAELPNFDGCIRNLLDSLILNIRDLRSSVCREACYTIAKISECIGNDFAALVEPLMLVLFRQVIINTKVMADSAHLCICHLVKNTSSSRLIGLINDQRDSKAAALRRRCAEYMSLILDTWDPALIARSSSTVAINLTASLNDADSGVRATARQAYWKFAEIHPEAAAKIMKGLDGTKQRMLEEAKDGDASSRSTSPLVRSTRDRSSSNPKLVQNTATPQRGGTASSLARRAGSLDDLHKSSSEEASTPRYSSTRSAVHRTPASRPPASGARIGRSASAKPSLATASAARALGKSGPVRTTDDSSISRSSSARPAGSASTGRPPSGARRAPVRTSPQTARRSPATARRSLAPRSTPPGSPASSRASSTYSEEGTFSEALPDVLRLSANADWSKRLEAVQVLRSVMRSDAVATPRDIRKISEYFSRQIAEPHNKVLLIVIEALQDFIALFREHLNAQWTGEVLMGLILKQGTDLPSATRTKIEHTLDHIRESYPVVDQFGCVIKLLTDGKIAQNTRVKTAMVQFFAYMLMDAQTSDWEAAHAAHPTDARAAVNRLVSMTGDPRSAELRKLAVHVFVELFNLSPPLMVEIVPALQSTQTETANDILTTHVGPDWRTAEAKPPSPRRPAPGESGPAAVPSSSSSSSLNGGGAPASSRPGYNPSIYQDADDNHLHERHERHDRHERASPLHRGGSRIPAPGSRTPSRQSSSSSLHAGETMTTALNSLKAPPDGSESNTEATLHWLARVSKESAPHVWEQQFESVLMVVLDVLNDPDPPIRELALRVLREMLKNQHKFFDKEKLPLVINRILERHKDSEREVLRGAEESVNVLADVIDPVQGMRILEPVLLEEDGPVLLAGIKLLTKLLKRLSAEQLEQYVDNIVPGLIKGYKHPVAEIRKGVVFALVEMHLVLGAKMDPYMSSLTSSQTKLLNIYIKRAEEKLAKEAGASTRKSTVI